MRRIEQGEDVEPENYLDLAVMQWLPRKWDCADCERALQALAVRFEERHGDRWLRDVLTLKQSAAATAGLQALSEAARANQADESDLALARSMDAGRLLGADGGLAGRLRAEFEQSYALHRRLGSGDECLKKAGEVEREALTRRYTWIRGQAVLEQGNCRSLLGQSGAAHNDMERAWMIARGAGYKDLELRAASILTEARTTAGNLLAAWEVGREGLAEYWGGAYSGIRGQQICLNLAESAQGLGLSQTAYVLKRAAVTAIAGTQRRRTEATTRAQLAELAARAGWVSEAETEFGKAASLFKQLPQTGGGYRTLAEVYRAQAEVTVGATDAALKRLEAVRPTAGRVENPIIQTTFYETLGDLYRLRRRPADAEASYREAIRLSEHGLSTLDGRNERAQFMRAAANAYRGMTWLLLDGGDAVGALRTWEWFRGADVPGRGAPSDLERWLPQLRRETFLTFAELPEGMVQWVYNDRGITSRRLAVRTEELEAVATRFLRACADRESDRAGLERDGRRLYDLLIRPVAGRLDASRTLVIQPDGAVAGIPLQALVGPDGRYLGEKFAITIAASLADYQQRVAAGPVQATARALVVADPGLGSQMARAFPPLPGTLREGRSVANRFHASVLLSGRAATLAGVEQHRTAAEVFHFAGHGFSNAGNGGLLLSPAEGVYGGAGVLDGRTMARQDWRRCRLAVLSACSAGTGETAGGVNPESLVRGLLWAGVARVVASRWNVDTEAGVRLMDQFYDSLFSGDDTAAALQHAAQRLRQDGPTSHPYFWAGFQSFGAR